MSSDFNRLKTDYYEALKAEKVFVQGSENHLICPLCSEDTKEKYNLKSLIAHTSRIVSDTVSASFVLRAKHSGLRQYLALYELKAEYYNDLKAGNVTVKGSEKSLKCPICWEDTKKEYTLMNLVLHASRIVRESESSSSSVKAKHLAVLKYLRTHGTDLEISRSRRKFTEVEEQYVLNPWMAIVANIPYEFYGGWNRQVDPNLSIEWKQRYNVLNLHPLENSRGFSGYAIAEFRKGDSGYKNAIDFTENFEENHRGKKNWMKLREKGKEPYAWLAGSEEYNSKGIIGEFLRKEPALSHVLNPKLEGKKKK